MNCSSELYPTRPTRINATPSKLINTHMHPMLSITETYVTALKNTGALLLWILRCSPMIPSVFHQQELCCSMVGIRPTALSNKLLPTYEGSFLDGKCIQYDAGKSSVENYRGVYSSNS
ncbi:hypothetical protein M422DRAFT_35806 [Sphaerobolus stellatus SS14]|uniref:Uncharacterized protein n=1 Tax=Sphaerobolus stellatus (strain SS14) TaxID=990650 RepID=A0A0C9TQU9_SPHS4|nr:hypothetical protein M422DRAFT_35806 [Sphaerobolus stellatus SS14]